MKRNIAVVIVLALAGCRAPSGPQPAAKPPLLPDPPARGTMLDVDREALDRAIDRAQRFLLAHRPPDGTWKDAPGTDRGAKAALAAMALLQTHTRLHDPRMAKALERLRELKTDSTDVLGLRARVWQLAREQNREFLVLLRRDVLQLVSGSIPGAYGPKVTSRAADPVNSHVGTMGVVAGMQANLEIPRQYWTKVLEYWLAAQNADGGWGAKTGGKSTPTMTAAGIAIVQGVLFARYDMKDLGRPPESASQALSRAEAWLDTNFADALKTGKHLPRLLHEVQRAALLTGQRHFGRIDWVRVGVARLLARQKPNGSWEGPRGPVAATAHALMFLRHTSRSVLFYHLRYDGDWNNWPQWPARLVPSLQDWPFCGWSVTWDTVSIAEPQAILREAPVLIVTGTEAPVLTQAELSRLQNYALTGGMIFSIAQGPAFDQGMCDVYRKLFPSRELALCPPEHPLHTNFFKLRRRPTLYTVSNGLRALAVHCTENLTREWHLGRYVTNKAAFQAAGNILMYAVRDGGFGLYSRGKDRWPAKYTGAVKRTVTMARLKYKGNYDPEPLAWERFARTMGHRTATRVNVIGPLEIGKLAVTKVKLAVLTGTAAFTLTPTEQQALKRFIADGGTLFIDAAGGDAGGKTSKGFAASVRKTLTGMFPKQKLTRLKIDSPIYTISPEPIKKVSWRRSTRFRMLGSMRPELRALVIDGRPAVIFSRFDITAGLLGATACGIDGYSPRNAYAIMRNIVMYAAKQQDEHKAK